MEKLLKLINAIGLKVEDDRGKYKGYSLNVLNYPVFRLWINKSGNLTVKTRGIQKSFKDWNDIDNFTNILQGFEII